MTGSEAPAPPLSLLAQFKKFLMETNAMALALAVVIGGAVSKLVTALVDGLIMPIVSLILPAGDWRAWKLVIKASPDGQAAGEKAILIGNVLASTLDFVIVASVVFVVATRILKIEIKR